MKLRDECRPGRIRLLSVALLLATLTLVLAPSDARAQGTPVMQLGANSVHDPTASPDPLRAANAQSIPLAWDRWPAHWYWTEQAWRWGRLTYRYQGCFRGPDTYAGSPYRALACDAPGHPATDVTQFDIDRAAVADGAAGFRTLAILNGIPRIYDGTAVFRYNSSPSGVPHPDYEFQTEYNINETPYPRISYLPVSPASPAPGPVPTPAPTPPPPYANYWGEYVRDTTTHLSAAGVRDFEVWNEPDLQWQSGNDPEVAADGGPFVNDYAALVQTTMDNAAPGVNLILGAPASPGDDTDSRYQPGGWIHRIWSRLNASVNLTRLRAFAIHPYGWPFRTWTLSHYLRQTLTGWTNKPIWVTEHGIEGETDPQVNANYTLQQATYARVAGVEVNIGVVRSWNSVPGLFDDAGQELPAARVSRLVSQYLLDATLENGAGLQAMPAGPERAQFDSFAAAAPFTRIVLRRPDRSRVSVLWANAGATTATVSPRPGSCPLLFDQEGGEQVVVRNGAGLYEIPLAAATPRGTPSRVGGPGYVLVETPCARVDIAFVIDLTGSMWDDIASVKADSQQIVEAIADLTAEYRVAVVGFKDFPVSPYGGSTDYPYRAFLPFSSSQAAIVGAIGGLSVGGGADWPESVYSGLVRTFQAEGLTPWRSDVSKVVVLLGDAPPHDPEPFTGYTLQSVVAAAGQPTTSLAPALRVVSDSPDAPGLDSVIVHAIVIGGDPQADAYFGQLAEQTGGKLFRASTANDVVRAILAALAELPERNRPPNCAAAYPERKLLWPPNHRMQDVAIAGVTDPDGDHVSVSVTAITQDEPVQGPGSGNTAPDGEGVGTEAARLRAERAGGAAGRVYRVSFSAKDTKGAQCGGQVFVCVPHDQGGNVACVDDGPVYDSTAP